MIADLAPVDESTRTRVRNIVASLMDGDGLANMLRKGPEINRALDPESTMVNATRAVTITGRVLEGIIAGHGTDSRAIRWIARIGLAGQALLAISLPGSMLAQIRSHWLAMLYGFEGLVLAFGLLFSGNTEIRTAALTAIGVTLAIHLASLVSGDVMVSRRRWPRRVANVVVAVVFACIAVAGFAVWKLYADWPAWLPAWLSGLLARPV
jgi:hypothetical protein